MKEPYSVVYFTSGQAMVFDSNNSQIPEIQKKFNIGSSNTKELKKIVKKCKKYYIGKWKEWIVELTKEEFEIITGLK